MFPRTTIENLSVSRMIIGTNWFVGCSHTSHAKDSYLKGVMTASKIADIMEVFVQHGIDTLMGQIQNKVLHEAVLETQQRTGKKLIFLSTPSINPGDRPEDFDAARKAIETDAQLGAAFCMPHVFCTDSLVDIRTRKIRNMDRYCRFIRDAGMLPGLSTHMSESIVYADESGLDVATYISIYNASGFLMHLEVDWVNKVIWEAKRPVITIKPLAAGRLLPLVGLSFVWSTIRPIDMVAIGTMSPDEAREVIEISQASIERRQVNLQLQKTRSKLTVLGW
jgi:hypothetical protein